MASESCFEMIGVVSGCSGFVGLICCSNFDSFDRGSVVVGVVFRLWCFVTAFVSHCSLLHSTNAIP